MNRTAILQPPTEAEERAMDASLDRALDLTAALQLAISNFPARLTRFEVVAGLVATIATVTAKMDEPNFSFALGAIRSADAVVLDARAAVVEGDKPETFYLTRSMLKAAFKRARTPVLQ